jgi:predicted PhzF superfamily epimerase YddE/YHI9
MATFPPLGWDGRLAPDATAEFHTRSGRLTAVRDGEWIELDFPATPASPSDAPSGLMEALGAKSRPVGMARSKFDYLCEFVSEEIIRDLAPDLSRLARIETRVFGFEKLEFGHRVLAHLL